MKLHERTPTPEDLTTNRVLAAASYVWLLFVLGLALSAKSPFARYHARQGAALFVLWLLNLLLTKFMIPSLRGLDDLLSLAVLVLMILGIVNAWKGRFRPLPLIGRLAE
jgi:uncharacterized membrane protein